MERKRSDGRIKILKIDEVYDLNAYVMGIIIRVKQRTKSPLVDGSHGMSRSKAT